MVTGPEFSAVASNVNVFRQFLACHARGSERHWHAKLRITHLTNRFNSAVFETLAAEEYEAVLVSPGFVNGAAWNKTDVLDYELTQNNKSAAATQPLLDLIQDLQDGAVNATLQRLENKACIQAYNNQFISGR